MKDWMIVGKGIRRYVFAVLVATIIILGNKSVASAASIAELQQQITAHQKELEKANNKVSDLKEAKSLIQELIDDLNAEILNTMTCIGLKEDEIAEKEQDILQKQDQIQGKQQDIKTAEKEYYEAKDLEESQKENMKIRARRLYETDSSSILSMLFQGNGISDMLNRADMAEQLYSYDRNRLNEYQETKKLVRELWDRLEEEKKQLETQKLQYETDKAQLEQDKRELASQKKDLDKALAARKKESAGYEAEIQKARQEASVAKTLIQQEQRELKKLTTEQRRGNTPAANANYTQTNYTSVVDNAKGSELGKRIAKYGLQYIGNKYQYGGTSLTNGTDCSGFTYRIYADFGYSITRTSTTQRNDGVGVSYSDAQPGDIICYSGHVGLYIGGGLIVHAASRTEGIKVSRAEYRPILAVRRII